MNSTGLPCLDPDSRGFIVLLGIATSMQALGTTMTIPALPAVAEGLRASVAEVQLTIGIYLAGVACGLVPAGALSDRFGRKPVLVGGTLLFCLFGLCAALSPNVDTLIASRFFQGACGATGMVIGRAMLRDLFEGPYAVRKMAVVGAIIAVMPMLAPLLGSIALTFLSWRGVYGVLAVISAGVALAMGLLIAESLKQADPGATALPKIFRNGRRFFTNATCLAFSSIMMFTYIGIFVFMAMIPHVVTRSFGLPLWYAGPALSLLGVASLLGHMISKRLAGRRSLRWILTASLSLCLASGWILLGLFRENPADAVEISAIVLLMMTYSTGFGITYSNATMAALQPLPDMAGTASALASGVQMIGGAFATWLAGRLFDGTPTVLGIFASASSLLAAVVFFSTIRRASPVSEAARIS